jgi:hypothetical protein
VWEKNKVYPVPHPLIGGDLAGGVEDGGVVDLAQSTCAKILQINLTVE